MMTWIVVISLLVSAVLPQGSLWACSVCFGNPESLASRGLVWGVTFMAVLASTMLGALALFFWNVAKKTKLLDQNKGH